MSLVTFESAILYFICIFVYSLQYFFSPLHLTNRYSMIKLCIHIYLCWSFETFAIFTSIYRSETHFWRCINTLIVNYISIFNFLCQIFYTYLVIYFQALMLILNVLCTAVLQTGEPDPDKNLIDPSPIELKMLSTGPIRKKKYYVPIPIRSRKMWGWVGSG